MESVTVRFAPSPTGYPHLGNVRTALFAWLFARHYGGKFILRIEDTDVARKVEGAVEMILDGLRWLGLDWDEGPYFQSQRLHLYREAAESLLKEDKAYLCYCTPARLDMVRQEQIKQKKPPKYDGNCRYLTLQDRVKLEASITPVVRFRTSLKGETSFLDLIRGAITFKNDTLDDFVLLKSGDYPDEYVQELKVITDDVVGHSMRVTFYTLAGILGAALIVSIFLSRRKLVPTTDEATGPPT